MATIAMYSIGGEPSPFPLTIGYLLWRVTMKWRTEVDRALGPLGLTHAQYTLLASLYRLSRANTVPSQRELADFTGLDPIYVSKLVRALEGSGLVDRTQHPADSRAMQLRLTAEGVDVARAAIDLVHALQQALTAPIGGIDGADNLHLTKTLRALLELSLIHI